MKISKKRWAISGILIVFCALCLSALKIEGANAISFAVSPMNNFVIINPGESYESSFRVLNPVSNDSDIEYEVKMEHFYEGDDGAVLLEEVGVTGQILDWTTLESPSTGTLAPNETVDLKYVINVPENAPGGGQYIAFTVEAKDTSTASSADEEGTNATLEQKTIIAYRVFVEVTGDVTRSGEILDVNVPGFLLGGNISGSSTVKNTGNVHNEATYTLQVFPLFSDEEVYTNEEDPKTNMIMPDRQSYFVSEWEDTPSVGIYNVVYTVKFAGLEEKVSKLVIICPIWLLFIIFFVIAAIIIWIVMRVRGRKKVEKSE
ncbi:hypothetical protein IJH01_00150 [Candidatus Saccharibacteria bacterium]|nr:hypothetical protein [Candidatus Saccharibacteria bacterium]